MFGGKALHAIIPSTWALHSTGLPNVPFQTSSKVYNFSGLHESLSVVVLRTTTHHQLKITQGKSRLSVWQGDENMIRDHFHIPATGRMKKEGTGPMDLFNDV